jgi:predicted nucleic-acid-binding Zn-ribbon protein
VEKMSDLKCPKCDGTMEKGFMAAASSGEQSQWVEGEPPGAWRWVGLLGRRKIPTILYRCVKCGYVEIYAPDTSAKE